MWACVSVSLSLPPSLPASLLTGAFEYINMRHCKENGDTPADISRLFIYYVGRKRDSWQFEFKSV